MVNYLKFSTTTNCQVTSYWHTTDIFHHHIPAIQNTQHISHSLPLFWTWHTHDNNTATACLLQVKVDAHAWISIIPHLLKNGAIMCVMCGWMCWSAGRAVGRGNAAHAGFPGSKGTRAARRCLETPSSTVTGALQVLNYLKRNKDRQH